MAIRCPECSGKLVRRRFEVACRRCGLVVDYPICLVEPEMFD